MSTGDKSLSSNRRSLLQGLILNPNNDGEVEDEFREVEWPSRRAFEELGDERDDVGECVFHFEKIRRGSDEWNRLKEAFGTVDVEHAMNASVRRFRINMMFGKEVLLNAREIFPVDSTSRDANTCRWGGFRQSHRCDRHITRRVPCGESAVVWPHRDAAL